MKSAMLVCVMILALGASVYAAASEPKVPKSNDRLAEADRLFNEGLKHRDRAWTYEEKAAAVKVDKDREVYLASARREYERAIELFGEATQENSRHYEAFGSLGYAWRKVGEYEAALTAYDRALKMKPDYAEALEYRAEAYLGLNRIGDARDDYEKLVPLNKDHARTFLAAAAKWAQGADPASESTKAFIDWVKAEQSKLGPPKGKTW